MDASPDREPALRLESIYKSYGDIKAVRGIELTLDKGEILGLLGPNGSGKSTTMKMVLGILKPDSGEVFVFGEKLSTAPVELKKKLGYVPETPQLYEFLTGLEYIDFVAEMYGVPPAERKERVSHFMDGLQLSGHENELISGYSQGMKQKVAIISALVHKPKVLVLDEALNGLDPRSARLVKDLVKELATEGVSILFSTHVLEIAQSLCDKVAIMYQGTILAEGTVAELRQKAGLPGSTLEEVFLKMTGTDDIGEVVKELSR
ncbi:MAG TPA: ABC transporter ATP-binding protein [Nitrososphaerales archaeon]|nr:ABC transporter ATP-binding protein [Nitrososphaerales archaeon]